MKKILIRIISFFISFLIMPVIIPSVFLICSVNALEADNISAPSAVVMDAETGKVLFEKNPHEVRACASITKVMTLTLVMEAIESGKLHYSDTITASEHAASMGGSDIWLEPGETMSADDMIKATIVASANDAAVALAETISGSEEEFVNEMNKKAKALGMKETVFKNCNGLDEDGHVTSAYDVAIMSKELIKHKKILEYSCIWMDNLRGGKTQLVNTNKLLKSYRGITGLKTGTTSQAGSCITATAERDGLTLIAVVLGCSSGKERFSDAATLLDYGFANYSLYLPSVPKEASSEISVTGGMEQSVNTTASANDSFLIKKGEEDSVDYEIILPGEIEAPVKKGQSVGKIIYKSGGKQIAEYPITAADDVEELSFIKIFLLLFHSITG